jgi:hypothetical protein
MTGAQFRKRVIAVHAKHTGAPKGEYGAMTWFGRHCYRTRRAVYRWTDSEMVDGEPLRILRLLQAMPEGTPWAADPALLDAALPPSFPGRQQLMRAGYRSQADVFHAFDEDLMKIPGIGSAGVRKIRSWWVEEPALKVAK